MIQVFGVRSNFRTADLTHLPITVKNKKPIHYTEDCPESTPEALAEFAAMARARRQRKTKPMVALRVEPETLEKYKSLGNGYTGIMGLSSRNLQKKRPICEARDRHQKQIDCQMI